MTVSYAALRARDMTSRITLANAFRVMPSKTDSSAATSVDDDGVGSVSTSSPHVSPDFNVAPSGLTFTLPSMRM